MRRFYDLNLDYVHDDDDDDDDFVCYEEHTSLTSVFSGNQTATDLLKS
jgi:hypothetical protein